VSVDVRPVGGRRDLRAFVELPYRLHSTSPHWIPPLRLERRLFLSRRFGPFFERGDAQLFLARRGDRVVGRVSAHFDRSLNAEKGNQWGLFGFLELEDDPEVARALLAAAEEWLRGQGRDRMVGPMDFTMNDESGILIEGFDRDPMVRQPWHPPHYQRLVEEDAGLEKVVDLLMWELDISDRESILPVIFELAEQSRTEHGIALRRMSRRRLRRDMQIFGDIYNAAWKRNWDFVPYSEKDLDHYAQEMQLVFSRDWFMVAEHAGEPVGVALTIPDVNRVLRVMKGRLLPLGWLRYLRRRRYVDRVRVGFLGVKPGWQHTGVAALLYVEHFDTARDRGPTWGEMGWILENNTAMNRGMEAMGGRIVKRFRVYERRFDPAAEPARPEGVDPA
jgi:GNAT superfamily N-acetyltransferase